MSAAVTFATMRRILAQLKHDHRTLALLIGVPTLLMILLRYVFDQPMVFDRIGPMLLGLFPFTVMFVVASVATLRERTSGTLERLMTMPLGKLDLLLGYALAFGLIALAQVGIVLVISLTWLGLDLNGSLVSLVDDMASWLTGLSDVLPLSYAVEGMQEISTHPDFTGTLAVDVAVIAAFTVVSLVLGAVTLRRRTA